MRVGAQSTRASNARWGEAQAALLLEGGRERPPLMDEFKEVLRER